VETVDRALFVVWPKLRGRLPWTELAELPTPVQPHRFGGGELWIKRDDLSSPLYGGNKVRTLEALFGRARADGVERIHSTGAFGSNHAAATVLHAPRAGLEAGVILFPQPPSFAALANLRVVLSTRPHVRALPHWSFLPAAMGLVAATDRAAGRRSHVMPPGGAVPEGALGYVSAALELAMQVERGEMPAPAVIVVGVGSTATSAGLLCGLRIAADLGLGWRRPPRLCSVRVTPWPVTSALRIANLAHRTGRLLARLSGGERLAPSRRALARGLEVDGRHLGSGYGHPTAEGIEAIRVFRDTVGIDLDTTYSAKAAAAALERLRADGEGPILFWSTKSTAPLPEVGEADWRWAPPRMTRWIERAQRTCPPP